MKRIDLTGQRFGKWTALHYAGRDGTTPGGACRCDCGETKDIFGHSLRRGDSTSCGCKYGLRPYENLLNILISSVKSKRLGIPIDLSYDDFVGFVNEGTCHYCKAPLTWVPCNVNKGGSSAYNLDRKDSSKGYTKDNCVPCCKRCNWGKNNHFTYHEWMQLAAVIRTWKQN